MAGAERIFREKVSGARADRRELNRLLAVIEADDVVVVTRIDRLARSTLRGDRDMIPMVLQKRKKSSAWAV